VKTLSAIFRFYRNGFRSMTLGRTLWVIIGIKLFVLFAVLKVFFFPNFLNSRFDNPAEKGAFVADQLTQGK
jgi:hypothetical protein